MYCCGLHFHLPHTPGYLEQQKNLLETSLTQAGSPVQPEEPSELWEAGSLRKVSVKQLQILQLLLRLLVLEKHDNTRGTAVPMPLSVPICLLFCYLVSVGYKPFQAPALHSHKVHYPVEPLLVPMGFFLIRVYSTTCHLAGCWLLNLCF